MIARRAFVVSLGALAASCGRGASLDRLILGEHGRVASVRSGEVLDLDDGLEVRLAGIEAPNGAAAYADAARDLLNGLAAGRAVTLLYGGLKRDRYARALAQVRRDKGRVWLQGELLRQGLARVRTYADNRAMAAEMLEAEAEARRAGRGLWSLAEMKVLLPAECAGRSGFQIIEGRVTRVIQDGQDIALSLDGVLPVQVPGFALSDFADAGKAPAGLEGRLVRVRGTLGRRPLRLDHPEALEILRG